MPQSNDGNHDGSLSSSNPTSKVLESVKKQGHTRPNSYSSSGSSEDTGGSDIGGGGELHLSRYTTRAPDDYQMSRGLAEDMENLNFEDDRDGDGNVDGTVSAGSAYDTRENSNGYNVNGIGMSPAGSAHSGTSAYAASHAATAIPPAFSTTASSATLATQNWSPASHPVRSREGSTTSSSGAGIQLSQISTNGQPASNRPIRPQMGRGPSHAYAPNRAPSQYQPNQHSRRTRSASSQRKVNPDADYRAQKKAYEARLKQDNPAEDQIINEESYPPSLGYSSGSESEEMSPTTGAYVTSDPSEQEAQLMFGNEDTSPSAEELKVPANRERLEWHSMLANVLTGDVVRQEKKRMTGAGDAQDQVALRYDIWVGVRARVCGRTLTAHKRMLDEQRAKAPTMIEDIISFEIRGEAEVGRTARQQIDDVVKEIDKVRNLYPTSNALEKAHARAASDEFHEACAAVLSWQATTELMETELKILQTWVGNEELDFQKQRDRNALDSHLTDDSSFIDRILKEDGLKSLRLELQPKPNEVKRPSLLEGIIVVIQKTKTTLIQDAHMYASKHLPPYIEELLTLINFPSRLVQEIIRVRLTYAGRIKDQAAQGLMIAEQMISQFQILLNLAVAVKEAYLVISQPEPGWDLPPCIDEKFDEVVLSAFQFYFKMLGWKISAAKNNNKEAEILEQEWSFLSALGRHFEGGDVEVAEQFAKMTNKSLTRLTHQFKKELQRRPDESQNNPDMDRRYRQLLDSVRVRQRKLFRFSRQLTNLFETTAEYSINLPPHQLQELYDDLSLSHHTLVHVSAGQSDNLFVLASPSLDGRPNDIRNLLGTCYRAEGALEDLTNPYVLILHPEEPLYWSGPSLDVDVRLPKMDIKAGKMRLVAYGGKPTLLGQKLPIDHAKAAFAQYIGTDLDIIVQQKSNFQSVDSILQRIRNSAFKLSDTIMDSVDQVRKQLEGLHCQELIQTCFAFATEFGQRSVLYMDANRRALNNLKLTRLALNWVSFICDDCVAADRKTFRWAVTALEFGMMMTRGQNILSISDSEYALLRSKVAGCMSLLISHFDIMGARSSAAANAEKQRMMDGPNGKFWLDMSKLKDDEESAAIIQQRWLEQLVEIDEVRKSREAEHKPLGRVLEDSSEADRSLTALSVAATNVTHRWQQGQYIGGGAFGSVYVATNLDTGYLMAVKEIRLQDPQMIPAIAAQIKDEMGVLQMLDNVNIVSYYGIEVHRDKVYIFMEYCAGGSFANLLEHGRIEDETVIMVYTLQMLEGLAYLHESGVIHRDIKPENILLDHNGVVKYVDFGAARVIARQTGRTLGGVHGPGGNHRNQGAAPAGGRPRSMTGTPMYMSPEVIRGSNSFASTGPGGAPAANNADRTVPDTPARPGAVDIWSLGCVVLEMATGRRPWASLDNEWAIMYNIAQGNPPQLPTRDQLSDAGIDFLKKCFERDASKRATAAELLQHEWIMRLRNQLSLEPQTTPQTPMTPTSDPALSRSVTGLDILDEVR